MLQLFIPANKVQKDRRIMRETDARMAKYSRRGLILNLLAFGLCLALGDFYQKVPDYALGLAIGLLVLTLWRGYFLFRFDSLYPRAPGRWRSQYFWASFLGAGWWSLIVASITYVVGMQNDTLLIWLYSVVFYSSVASVLSPYRKFLGLYLFIGQIPAAVTAITLATWEGYIYGVTMLVFYLLLDHQGEVNSRIYWDRLEAQYNLDQHAKNLEIEKRDTQAAAELKDSFLTRFGTEIRTSLNDILGALSLMQDSNLSEQQKEYIALAVKAGERQLNMVNAAVDFSQVTRKNLVLEHAIFNLWKLIEQLVEDVSHDAYQQQVELNHVLDSDTPIRVKGDSHRLRQILINLLSHAIKHSASGSILFKSEFVLKNDTQGELQITVVDEVGNGKTHILSRQEQHVADEAIAAKEGEEPLGITLCKGIAEFMNGSLQVFEEPGRGKQYFFNLTLELTSKSPKALSVNPQLRNKRMLLAGIPESMVDSFLIELEAWGMHTRAVQDADAAVNMLEEAIAEEEPYDGLFLYTRVDNLDLMQLTGMLSKHKDLSSLPVIIATTLAQRAFPAIAALAEQSQYTVLLKPVLRKNLHQAVCQSLLNEVETVDDVKKSSKLAGRRILLVDDHRVNQMVTRGMLNKLGYKVLIANNGKEALAALAEHTVDLVLMDCQMPEMDGYEATREIRKLEAEEGSDNALPVLAMTAHAGESDQSKCFAAGMSDYLAKPVSYEQLEQSLKRWLGKGKAAEPGED